MEDKMLRHGFGTPVICKVCGQPVSVVFAVTWEEAHTGQGVCETCQQAPPPAPSKATGKVGGKITPADLTEPSAG